MVYLSADMAGALCVLCGNTRLLWLPHTAHLASSTWVVMGVGGWGNCCYCSSSFCVGVVVCSFRVCVCFVVGVCLGVVGVCFYFVLCVVVFVCCCVFFGLCVCVVVVFCGFFFFFFFFFWGGGGGEFLFSLFRHLVPLFYF